MSALSIVSNAMTRLGFSPPTSVFSNPDDTVGQLRNLLNQEGVELAGLPWTRITVEKTFTTTAAAIQTSAVPTDFGFYLDDTMWNRSTTQKIAGPVSSEEWQAFQANALTAALPFAFFRFRGGDILIGPTPTAGQTVAYEYISLNWCEDNTGADMAAMVADSDVGLLDESLLTLGITWRYLQAKGLDYAEAFRTYELEVQQALSRDGGKPKRYLNGPPVRGYRGNVAEGSWPL